MFRSHMLSSICTVFKGIHCRCIFQVLSLTNVYTSIMLTFFSSLDRGIDKLEFFEKCVGLCIIHFDYFLHCFTRV